MKRQVAVTTTVVVSLLWLANLASAAAPTKLRVNPWVYDPYNLGIISSAWVTGQGLPDAGKSDHALFLQKNGLTAAYAAAGASVYGAEGLIPTEFGFDVRTDGHCGAGAPRFDVQATDGFHFVGGCANGTFVGTTVYNGFAWVRVRFNPYNPGQAFPPFAPGARIQSVDVVFDEGTDVGPDFTGFVYFDNIDVNGILVGKPGDS